MKFFAFHLMPYRHLDFDKADAAPSPLSYRSAFLARKAVDELAAARR